MNTKPICPGTRTMTNFADAHATCPVCKAVKKTNANGRITPHYGPAKCAALAYSGGRGGTRWPGPCSAKAKPGSKYCGRHGG
jgi:hypothetical protein